MTGTVTGKEFHGVLEGGAAAGGGYVWVTWIVGAERQTVLFEQSTVGPFMAAIGTAAAMAADERQQRGLLEPNSAYALKLSGAEAARSDIEAGASILDLSIDAQRDTPWHLYLSAAPRELMGLRAAIDRALEMLAERRVAN